MRVKREGKGPSQGTHLVSIRHKGHAPRDTSIRTGNRQSFVAPPPRPPVCRKGPGKQALSVGRADVTAWYPSGLAFSAHPSRESLSPALPSVAIPAPRGGIAQSVRAMAS